MKTRISRSTSQSSSQEPKEDQKKQAEISPDKLGDRIQPFAEFLKKNFENTVSKTSCCSFARWYFNPNPLNQLTTALNSLSDFKVLKSPLKKLPIYTATYKKEQVVVKFFEEYTPFSREALGLYLCGHLLSSPNVIQLKKIGFDKHSSRFFLVMERADNSLDSFLKQEPSLSWEIKLQILLDIALALQDINQYVIHADINSYNILINDDYKVKIADFGCCRMRHETFSKLNGTGGWSAPERRELIFDKSNFMSHEQLLPSEVYSFGMVVNYTIFGEDILDYKKIPSLKKPEKCPQALIALMDRCQDEEPSNRPTISKVVEELNTIMQSLLLDSPSSLLVDLASPTLQSTVDSTVGLRLL